MVIDALIYLERKAANNPGMESPGRHIEKHSPSKQTAAAGKREIETLSWCSSNLDPNVD
jgi:hypothetical protein